MSPHFRYFQGRTVTGPVHASAAQNWSDVVDTFRICPTLPLTHSAFLALDKKSRNEAKQVPFFVPACFRESPSQRAYSEATVCNLLFLDIDNSQDAAPFVNNPAALYEALSDFNFIAHTTASSTPENPRMRIVIDADAIPIHQYRAAVESIGALLALSKVTTESKVAVQCMFLATQFADSTDEEHPLIAHRLDGRAFTVEDISAVGTDQYQSNGQNGTNGHTPPSSDALFFLKAPVPEISLAITKEALHAIDPDLDRAQWRDVAAALRHQFSPQRDEEAYELFDEWSSGGTKYGGEEDTRKMWKSLRPTPVGRMPVTIRSLLHKAVQAGWDDKRVKENSYNRLLDWMEAVPTATELLEQGVQKILSAPLMSTVQEAMLIDELRKHAKRRFAINVQATAIKQDLVRLKAQVKSEAASAQKLKEPMWARGLCYITNTEEFFRPRTGEKYTSKSLNAAYSRWLLPTEEQLREQDKPINPVTLSTPIIAPDLYALNHLKITTVTDFAYDPSQPNEKFFVNGGIKFVNNYSPTYPELDPKNAPAAGALFQEHLKNLVAEEEYRRILIDFMAFMVQFPGRKIRWSPIIQGAEGCGKTLLAEMQKAVHGKEHVKTIDGTAVLGGWNDWAFGYQLVVLEEVRVQGTNRYDIMNRLKPWITNEDIPINEKFRSSRDVRNITNYMMFSNHHDCLALTPQDRRYFVIKSPLQTKAQVQALGDQYFSTLFKMLRDRAGALRSFLADWDISTEFRPDGHAPRTKYIAEMVQDSANDVTACVRQLLLDGDHPLVQYDIVSAKALMDMLNLQDGLARVSGQQLAHVLREEGFTQVGRYAFGDERHYLWVRGGVDVSNAFPIADQRHRTNAKNLCMELLFS
jgi:hypothetical protein